MIILFYKTIISYRLPLGSLGMLQVVESHKRLGLGSLLVRYMSKKISELDEEVLSSVLTENTPSRKMFEKLGFEQIFREELLILISSRTLYQ